MRTTRAPRLDKATLDYILAQFQVRATAWRRVACARPGGRPITTSGEYQATATCLVHAEGIEDAIRSIREELLAERGKE